MRSGGPAQPKQAYAHDAVLLMAPGGDERAPGGAVTLTLCGSWSHEPPCPLAPHHTAVSRTGDGLRVRVLFAAAPRDEERVRALIDAALRSGGAPTPDGPPGDLATDLLGGVERPGRRARPRRPPDPRLTPATRGGGTSARRTREPGGRA
jgi:hypothetical protein